MKKFIAVFTGSENSENHKAWEKLSPAEREKREKEGMAAWHKWVKDHEKSIVDVGAPLGSTLLVNKKGISPSENNLCAYTIVKANSMEEAAKIFLNHPHFTIFPGIGIEVMDCLDIPGL